MGRLLKEHLNINVELQTIDRQAFYDAMNAKPTEILFGWVSYGMDYFDPSNMLSVWLTGGRHSWSNEEYDKLVNEGQTLAIFHLLRGKIAGNASESQGISFSLYRPTSRLSVPDEKLFSRNLARYIM